MRHSLHWLFVGVSLLVASGTWGAGAVTLASGGQLTITETGYSRALPHTFYDQAMSSLPRLYPGHRLLAGRRAGVSGDVVYALVCYRETPSSEQVVIEAVAVVKDRAWSIRAITPAFHEDALVEVLEHIAKLPTDGAVQRPTASGRR